MAVFDQSKRQLLSTLAAAALTLSASSSASDFSMRDEVKEALSNAQNIQSVQVMGDANAHRNSTQLTNGTHANNTNAASDFDSIRSIDIHGESDFERHSAKLIGKNLASAAVLEKTAHGLMESLKPEIDNLVYADRINVYASFHEFMSAKNINAPSATAAAEEPETITSHDLDSAGSPVQCSVVIPSPDAKNLTKETLEFYQKTSSSNDSQSKVDAYKFAVYHEIAHCLNSEIIDQRLSSDFQIPKLKDELLRQSSIRGAQSGTLASLVDDIEMERGVDDFKQVTHEMFGDSFAALKMQKDYYAANKDDIINNRMPAIAPVIEKVARLRADNAASDSDHNTSSALNRIIEQLKKPWQLEALASAGDDEILITAYHAVDMSRDDALAIAGLKQKVDDLISEADKGKYQLDGYMNSGFKPIFDLSGNKKKASEVENDEQNTLSQLAL